MQRCHYRARFGPNSVFKDEHLREEEGTACLVRCEADEDHDGGEGEEPEDELNRHGWCLVTSKRAAQTGRSKNARADWSPASRSLFFLGADEPCRPIPNGRGARSGLD